MKFLRSPIVSGILAVLAVLVVVYQFAGTNIHFPRLGGTAGQVVKAIAPALVAPPPPAPAPAPAAAAAQAEAAPDPTIDGAYLEARFAKWVAAPLRDPFLLFSADPKLKDDDEFKSPIDSWHLNGIWDQTGGKLAVINKHVYRVGDVIEGYKIYKIEGEEVWFQGPKHKERLALEKKGPSVIHNPVFLPATNEIPATAVPQ